MAAGARLDAILEALEIADDSTSSYFDLETGEVHSITEEEFSLAKNPRKDLPAWQHESVDLACSIRQSEGKRFLLLPGKFEIQEWEIMARFATRLEDAQIRDDFCGGIRGPGAFRRFKELLKNTTCGIPGINSSKPSFDRSPRNGAKSTAFA